MKFAKVFVLFVIVFSACLFLFLCFAMVSRAVLYSTETAVTGALVQVSGGLPSLVKQMGGTWIQPVRVETNQVFQPDGSSRREIQFIFQTTEPNVGGVVLSRLHGEKTWSMEAYQAAPIQTCVVGSLWFKDCRVLLIRDPDMLEAQP